MLDIESIVLKNISYLHARDPSILAWNRHCLDEVRINLADELLNDNTRENSGDQKPEEHNLQVFLRIKDGIPFENLYSIDGDNLICNVPDGSRALRNIKEGESMTKMYSFTKIFNPQIKQIEIFNSIVRAKMLGFINGRNSTLLAYGASGSGKTFTIVGTAEEPGVIPRALEYVFRTIPQLQEAPKVIPMPNGDVKYIDEQMVQMERLQKSAILNATLIDRTTHIKTYRQMQQRLSSEVVAEIDDLADVSVSIWVSFAEIYNENIYDLLKTPPPRGKQRPRLRLGNSKDGCFIKDLTSVHVTSGIEAYQILQFGLHNLKYAATSVNSHSSRSHCIFTIKLIQVSETDKGMYISTFNFCDLAGSERVKKTMNVGDRLKESNNINTSLLVLGKIYLYVCFKWFYGRAILTFLLILNVLKFSSLMQQRLSSEVVAEIDDLADVSVSIWVSFAEIYNENIYDLLKTPPPRGKQRPRLRLGNSKDGCFIKDLTSVHVTSGIEAYQILQFGLHNLKYAATSVNSHSSRSHCIFTIKLIQVSETDKGMYISTFNFCDLAGSERVKKTMNVGDRLKESNNINTSLLVLGRCISNIRSAQQLKDNRLIPFRESKLTQLFQKALMGLENIMMIVNINPSRDMFDESQHVLNFSAIAKEISVDQPKLTKPKKKNRFSLYMEGGAIEEVQEEDEKDIEMNRLKEIISDLYTEIENMRREFKIEQKMERDYIISSYKEFIDRLTQDKDRAINEVKKELEEANKLVNYYSNILDQEDVISVDSSSEDEDSPSKLFKKEKEDLEKIISEQNSEINNLRGELRDVRFEMERLEKEVQVVPKLRENIKNLTEDQSNLKVTLIEAKEAYSELQSEIQEEQDKNKKLTSENLQLKERVEYLEEQLSLANISN
ncbi:kinesin-like protein subito [Anoplophora glabripennis]|uniref:kinesin-like protein subito n=1 Tax=Anoplophora glabripennis TaxID=217634 RepID=UPI000874CF51|nr:kinesin-like protein subito [Anoplophora glabripennis]